MDKSWRRVAVFLLGLTSIISGCNSGRIQPPESPRQIEATVPGWALGEAVVVAQTTVPDNTRIAQGSIAANGAFTLTLPMTLQEDQLVPFAFELLDLPESCREAITIDPPGVLVASLANLPVERGLERIAVLEQGNSSTLIVRFYTAAPLSISGRCTFTAESGSQTVSYDIDAASGWSLVATTTGGSSTLSETGLGWLAYPPVVGGAVGQRSFF